MNPEQPRPTLRGQRIWSSRSVVSKHSIRSYTTSSFEADDELSSADEHVSSAISSNSDDDHDYHTRRRRRTSMPAYSGRDARPTSRKELSGWYMYGFAAETYMICGIGSFIPILLETLARENGVLFDDPTTPCGSSNSKNRDDGQCVVRVLGIQINTASFAMYTFSVSVLLQALLVVSISCAADHGNYRKKGLLAFAWVGSFCMMAYIFISKEVYILGALLTIISNVSFGASFVLLNSFLPLLVRHHPDIIEAAMPVEADLVDSALESRPMGDSTGVVDESMVNSASSLLSASTLVARRSKNIKAAIHEAITSKELQLSTHMSGKGIGIGYSAGLVLQCVSIGILIAMHNTTWSLRVVLFITGLWWAVFTIPAAMWLRPRPGPPLAQTSQSIRFPALAYLVYSWKSLFTTVRLAWRLRDIMLFLAGWFLLSDAIATTSSTAILFAKTTLHMEPWALGMINVITTLAGVIGAFGWSAMSARLGLKPHQTILVCIALFELIPVYGLLGYLPFVQSWGALGLQQPWEMYPLAAVYGLVLGGLSSYCRSLYGELIPPGSEAAFYALYAITDKGSSVVGPSIVAAIIDRSGSIRPAFWFLAALVGCPAPLMWLIKVERGKAEGAELAERIEGFEVRSDADAEDEDESRGFLRDGGGRLGGLAGGLPSS